METKEYAQGQTIFKVGESADGLFIIGSGEVGIYFPENREMKKPNQILKETQIFGEMGVIDSQLRTASAKAHTDVHLLFVSKEDFDKKIAEGDIVVRGVIAVLSDRLRPVSYTHLTLPTILRV